MTHSLYEYFLLPHAALQPDVTLQSTQISVGLSAVLAEFNFSIIEAFIKIYQVSYLEAEALLVK